MPQLVRELSRAPHAREALRLACEQMRRIAPTVTCTERYSRSVERRINSVLDRFRAERESVFFDTFVEVCNITSCIAKIRYRGARSIRERTERAVRRLYVGISNWIDTILRDGAVSEVADILELIHTAVGHKLLDWR